MKCDRCGDESSSSWTLKNVYYSDSMVSMLKSTYQVCDECYEHIKESDNWEI